MTKTVGDFLVSGCKTGVCVVFGYPGDGINGLLGALERAEGDRVRAGAPRGDGRLHGLAPTPSSRGEVGVCLATSGPGATHLVTGLYDAKLDHSRCWPSPASRRAPRSAASTSRRSTSERLSRTSVTSSRGQRRRADAPHDRPRMRIAKRAARVTAIIVPNDLQDCSL